MKVYTRTGDRGETDLVGGDRVRKDTPRLEVCGTLDELNAVLGMARAESLPEDVDRLLRQIQGDLFSVAAQLTTPETDPASVEALERAIDRYDAELPPLRHFILPAGSRAGAALHVARTVCRRAERRLVTLIGTSESETAAGPLAYLNRLSDLLFVLARTANAADGQKDTTAG
jgi:cob(I)alamin adenosyltransferase